MEHIQLARVNSYLRLLSRGSICKGKFGKSLLLGCVYSALE